MGQTSEAIVLAETHEMYIWVMRMQISIEPRRSLSSIRLIFGDRLITRGLLSALGIERSCLLHGDYYHLMYENWPMENNFGQVVFNSIKTELRLMLSSLTKHNWDNAYLSARDKISEYPDKIKILDAIYNDPKYYSGYYLRTIHRNMTLHDNSPAEQNHPSLYAFLGDSMCQSLAKEVQKLLQRHQQKYKEDRQHDVSVHISGHNYKSDFLGEKGIQDVLAKKHSLHMYNLLDGRKL